MHLLRKAKAAPQRLAPLERSVPSGTGAETQHPSLPGRVRHEGHTDGLTVAGTSPRPARDRWDTALPAQDREAILLRNVSN
jgi:hypothetical protein